MKKSGPGRCPFCEKFAECFAKTVIFRNPPMFSDVDIPICQNCLDTHKAVEKLRKNARRRTRDYEGYGCATVVFAVLLLGAVITLIPQDPILRAIYFVVVIGLVVGAAASEYGYTAPQKLQAVKDQMKRILDDANCRDWYTIFELDDDLREAVADPNWHNPNDLDEYRRLNLIVKGTGPDSDRTTTLTSQPTAEEVLDLNNALSKISGKNSEKACFVATAAFDDEFHETVCLLRGWRDQTLNTTVAGRLAISFYYQIGPVFARGLNRLPSLKPAIRRVLTLLAQRVQNSQDRLM